MINLFGGWDNLFRTFTIFVVINFLSFILKAIYENKFNKRLLINFVINIVGYYLIILIATSFDTLEHVYVRDPIIYMFIIDEGIKIINNLSSIGITVPNILKNMFITKGDGEDKQNN